MSKKSSGKLKYLKKQISFPLKANLRKDQDYLKNNNMNLYQTQVMTTNLQKKKYFTLKGMLLAILVLVLLWRYVQYVMRTMNFKKWFPYLVITNFAKSVPRST